MELLINIILVDKAKEKSIPNKEIESWLGIAFGNSTEKDIYYWMNGGDEIDDKM